jgi:hypothetical protein
MSGWHSTAALALAAGWSVSPCNEWSILSVRVEQELIAKVDQVGSGEKADGSSERAWTDHSTLSALLYDRSSTLASLTWTVRYVLSIGGMRRPGSTRPSWALWLLLGLGGLDDGRLQDAPGSSSARWLGAAGAAAQSTAVTGR